MEPILFSAHGGRMDPSKLFRAGGVSVLRGTGGASDSEASQHSSVKLRPKLESSALKPKVLPAPPPPTCCVRRNVHLGSLQPFEP